MSYLINKLGTANQNPFGSLFSQTATVTVANTTTETTLIGAGEGSVTLPADFFIVGRSIKLYACGVHSSTGNPTITVRVKYGSTTIGTITGTSGNGSNDTWTLQGIYTLRTAGSSGTLMGQSEFFEVHPNGLRVGTDATTTTTINTTASNALNITVQWGTASSGNTISATNLFLGVVN